MQNYEIICHAIFNKKYLVTYENNDRTSCPKEKNMISISLGKKMSGSKGPLSL